MFETSSVTGFPGENKRTLQSNGNYENTLDLFKQAAEKYACIQEDLKINKQPDENCQKCEEHKKRVDALVSENVKLRAAVKTYRDINKDWIKHDKEQRNKFQMMFTNIRDLEERIGHFEPLTQSSSSSGISSEASSYSMISSSSSSKVEDSSSNGSTNKSLHAICIIREQSLEDKLKVYEKEKLNLLKQVDEMFLHFDSVSQELDNLRMEHANQSEAMEIQIKQYKEDFEAEKLEKVEAKNRVKDLEDEVAVLKKKCLNYRDRLQLIEETCTVSGNKVTSAEILEAEESERPEFPSLRNSGRSSPAEVISKTTTLRPWLTDAELKNQFLMEEENNERNMSSFDLINFENDDPKDAVECPGCRKPFPSSCHLQFLDHFEECQRRIEV